MNKVDPVYSVTAARRRLSFMLVNDLFNLRAHCYGKMNLIGKRISLAGLPWQVELSLDLKGSFLIEIPLQPFEWP